MDKYVPYGDTGNLRDKIDKGVDYITYEATYAHYQYTGTLYVMDNGKGAYYSPDYGYWSKKGVAKNPSDKSLNYHTAGTGAYWDEKMWTAEKDKVLKEVQNYVAKRGNR